MSLLQIIGSPEKFDGKLVRVVGYCSIVFEGNALYLHKEDYDAMLLPNSVALDFEEATPDKFKSVSKQYCLVEGRYSAPAQRVIMSRGSPTGITRLERRPSRAEIQARPR